MANNTWGWFQKKPLTKMRRIMRLGDLPNDGRLVPAPGGDGFRVQTREGWLFSPWGSWLAIDSGGHPYPIAADEQERIYVFVQRAHPSDNLEADQ